MLQLFTWKVQHHKWGAGLLSCTFLILVWGQIPHLGLGFQQATRLDKTSFWLTITTVQLLGVTIFSNSRVAETAILVNVCWLCSTKPIPERHKRETSQDLASTLIWGKRCGISQCDVMLGMVAHQTMGNFCFIFQPFSACGCKKKWLNYKVFLRKHAKDEDISHAEMSWMSCGDGASIEPRRTSPKSFICWPAHFL